MKGLAVGDVRNGETPYEVGYFLRKKNRAKEIHTR